MPDRCGSSLSGNRSKVTTLAITMVGFFQAKSETKESEKWKGGVKARGKEEERKRKRKEEVESRRVSNRKQARQIIKGF
jgi:hypothetical protein